MTGHLVGSLVGLLTDTASLSLDLSGTKVFSSSLQESRSIIDRFIQADTRRFLLLCCFDLSIFNEVIETDRGSIRFQILPSLTGLLSLVRLLFLSLHGKHLVRARSVSTPQAESTWRKSPHEREAEE